jgi:hypothetical protein
MLMIPKPMPRACAAPGGIAPNSPKHMLEIPKLTLRASTTFFMVTLHWPASLAVQCSSTAHFSTYAAETHFVSVYNKGSATSFTVNQSLTGKNPSKNTVVPPN